MDIQFIVKNIKSKVIKFLTCSNYQEIVLKNWIFLLEQSRLLMKYFIIKKKIKVYLKIEKIML